MERLSVHKVGLTAVVVGAPACALLAFGAVSPNRIVTARQLTLWQLAGRGVVSGAQAAAVVALWGLVALLCLWGAHERPWSRARGLAAGALIVYLMWLSGSAASRVVEQIGGFARYSVGGGVWLAVFAAFTLVVAARREVGPGSASGYLVALAPAIGFIVLLLTGRLASLGMLVEYRNVADEFWVNVGLQLLYSGAAIVIASLIGVALGVTAYLRPRAKGPIFAAVSVFQTVPGLAMVGILVVPLAQLSRSVPVLRSLGVGGIGWAPLVIALVLYALLSITRNTYAGLASVPATTVEAGRGMGMSSRQLLQRVQGPLALPIGFSGVRTASQQTVGNATLGAFVAAGGLGEFIILGVAQQAPDLVLLGSVALVALAVGIDGLMRGAQRLIGRRRTRREPSR